MRHILPSFLIIFCFASNVISQDVKLNNPSFEDTPRMGTFDAFGNATPAVSGWFDCGLINFPRETPTDVHPNDFWKNNIPASRGNTYVGMVVRDNETNESIAQKLSTPLEAGNCYYFSIDLCRSDNYWSKTRSDISKTDNYITPVVLRLWGGKGFCTEGELLFESQPVNSSKWKTYSFKVSPTIEHTHIIIEAYYKTPVMFPYNGHLLVDNASDLVKIDCDVDLKKITPKMERRKNPPEEPKQIAEVKKKAKKKVKPKDTVVFKKEKKEIEVDTEVYVRPKLDTKIDTHVYIRPKKILEELDRNTIKTGQTIRIKELRFEANSFNMDQESHKVLDELYEFLNQNQDIIVELGGHTNGLPKHAYCDKLSKDRAQIVCDYLVEKGIEKSKIRVKGYGKRKPIAGNNTVEGRKRNQRVEIKILEIIK